MSHCVFIQVKASRLRDAAPVGDVWWTSDPILTDAAKDTTKFETDYGAYCVGCFATRQAALAAKLRVERALTRIWRHSVAAYTQELKQKT